jgi:demethylmenaquinone methyltransferase/2-methoxy-6-polyprenyl-1,4-benzoquinol methylase
MAGNDVVHEAFAELAPRYEETMDLELRGFLGIGYREFVDRLLETAAVDDDDLVLDVATGTALLPRRLVERVGAKSRVVGLDITPEMLSQGRASLETSGSISCISLVCASGMAMPLAAGTFDLVLCAFGTHHMDAPLMLSEMRRVLKPGGKLVLVEGGASLWWRSFWGRALLEVLLFSLGVARRTARAEAEREAFSNIHTPDEWQAMLLSAHFEQVEIVRARARRGWYPCVLTMRAVAKEN